MSYNEDLDHDNIFIENKIVKYIYDVKIEDLPDFINTQLKTYLDSHIAAVVSTSLILLFFFYYNFL